MPSAPNPDDTGAPEVADTSECSDTPEAADGNSPEASEKRPSKGADLRGIAVGGVLLAGCAGVVVYGVLHTAEKPERHHAPTAAVTYEVEGKGRADITYQARSESGDAVVADDVTLPWKRTVRVPFGTSPLVTITLGEKGGRASCQLAVRGRHVQTATAFGKFGRATCQSELPSPEPSVPQ
ncbi:hypothetical protein [Streptomyces sp. NPDC048309]|uniref:hypothetical protein n=1 Tax=Streptomyces sp. NPDC048309 TaxID=3154618 RepID=UPI0033D4310F